MVWAGLINNSSDTPFVRDNYPELTASAKDAEALAARLLQVAALPKKAEDDALHIAVAAVNGMEFLLTWNCTHIANARTREIINRCCRNAGYEPPVICTPAELAGG